MAGRPPRPRTPVTLSDFARELVDEARGHTPYSTYVGEAAVARAAYELGQRSGEPGRTMLEIIERLRAK